MLQISFVLLGEGSSDAALVPHLEELCLLCGAGEVSGVAPDLALLPEKVGHRVSDKLATALRLEPAADLVFIHRDADGTDAEPRREEIRSAVRAAERCPPAVPVVPVQKTEAWLLLDELQIRKAADNPSGRNRLEIPLPEEVEGVAEPKQTLFDLLCLASELSGRRLHRFKRTLARRRRRLIDELRCDSPVSRVPTWQRLRADVEEALADLPRGRAEAETIDHHRRGQD